MKTYQIRNAQLRLLESLCQATSVSGDERDVRRIVLDAIEPLADELEVDPIGNVLAVKKGRGRNRLRVMMAAHMDEIGFMITADDRKGMLRFDKVGGMDARQLVGKAVVVGREQVPGVIGAKAIHLTTASERRRSMSIDSLRIDLGPEPEGRVKVGDRATFAPNFQVLGRGSARSVSSKALDDRVGVASLIEHFRHAPENIDLLAAFTTQEEIGLRGAKVAADNMKPDLAIALDCTPALDLPAVDPDFENARYNARLGAGPAIYQVDGATLSDPRLVRYLQETAARYKIPYQLRQPGGGGTDAGAIHKSGIGVPSISISVPGRYMHTSAGLIRVNDWRAALNLVAAALTDLRPKLLNQPRQ
jgi:endoglucanase